MAGVKPVESQGLPRGQLTMDREYLDHYREHGYAVVPGVFTAAEVGELAAAFDRVYAQGLAHGASFRHQNLHYRLA